MPKPPDGTKTIQGLTGYGIDENSEWVFFGFKLADSEPAMFQADHFQLGATIHYLQSIAGVAQQRRLRLDPNASDREVQGKPSNPVATVDFLPDVQGKLALLTCLTTAGTTIEAMIPFHVLVLLQAHLPDLLAVMKQRQIDSAKANQN